MVHDQRSALSTYMAGLLAAGRVVFTGVEAAQALGVGRGAFLDAARCAICASMPAPPIPTRRSSRSRWTSPP